MSGNRQLPRVISTLNLSDSRVMRSAVFPRFVGHASKAADWTQVWSFRLVAQAWARWLESALKHDFQVIPERIKKAFYCPPPSFLIRRRSQPCDLSRVCPFCYMRDAVRPAWAAVQSFRDETEDFDEKYRLCDYTERVHLPECTAAEAVDELRRCKRHAVEPS